MNNQPITFDATIEYFQALGARAVREYHYQPNDPMQQMSHYAKGSEIGVKPSFWPVYAAALLGFSTPLIADALRRAGVTSKRLSQYLEFNGLERHTYGLGASIDPVELSKKLVEACVYRMSWDERDEKLFEIMESHSIFGIGVMNMGLEGVNFHAQIDAEMEALKAAKGTWRTYEMECRAGTLDDVLMNIHDNEHLPNGSAIDLIEMSGSLHPAVLKKMMGTGFWESVVLQGARGYSAYPNIITTLIKRHPETAVGIFKTLDFHTTDLTVKNEDIGEMYTLIEGSLGLQGLGAIDQDASYKLGAITAYTREMKDSVTFDLDDTMLEEIFHSSSAQEYFKDLRDLGADLYGEMMLSHMAIPEANLSHLQFKAWDYLRDLEPVAQRIPSNVFSAYLAHMAKAQASVFPESHENLRNYKESVIDPVNDTMNRLVSQHAQSIDYSTLKELDEDAKSILSVWGLGLRELGIKRAKTIDQRIGADLGL